MQDMYGMCGGPGSHFWWCLKHLGVRGTVQGLQTGTGPGGAVAAGRVYWGTGGAAPIPG